MNGWESSSGECWGGRPVARRIADAAPRRRVEIAGTVVHVEVGRWRRVAACTASLDDGTGRMTLVFTGTRPVSGLVEGARCRVEGTVLAEDGELSVWNPLYGFEL